MITGHYNNTGYTIYSDGEQVAQTIYTEIVEIGLAKADCKKDCVTQSKSRNEEIRKVSFKMCHGPGDYAEDGE